MFARNPKECLLLPKVFSNPSTIFRWLVAFFIVVMGTAPNSLLHAEPSRKSAPRDDIPPLLLEKLKSLQLPSGFQASIYAVAPGARSLALSPKGTLFVGNGGYAHPGSEVFGFRDQDADGYAEEKYVLLKDGDNPNGVAFLNGNLYVAEKWGISVLKDIENHLKTPPVRQNIGVNLPRAPRLPVATEDAFGNKMTLEHHAWKYLAAGPDGWLYTAIGAPCNICAPDAPMDHGKKGPYAGHFNRIFRVRPDGSTMEEYARGVRNPMGLTWHPLTQELWFTDNGRDLLGNDNPADELNHAPKQGLHFGYPCFHSTSAFTSKPNQTLEDPQIKGAYCKDISPTQPKLALGPHVASLGLRFHHGRGVPSPYKNAIFIAEHGSWNRSGVKPSGYQVSVALPQPDGSYRYESFATGWLESRGSSWEAWGRPVDISIMSDGSILISDDKAGLVYRVVYRKAR